MDANQNFMERSLSSARMHAAARRSLQVDDILSQPTIQFLKLFGTDINFFGDLRGDEYCNASQSAQAC